MFEGQNCIGIEFRTNAMQSSGDCCIFSIDRLHNRLYRTLKCVL